MPMVRCSVIWSKRGLKNDIVVFFDVGSTKREIGIDDRSSVDLIEFVDGNPGLLVCFLFHFMLPTSLFLTIFYWA